MPVTDGFAQVRIPIRLIAGTTYGVVTFGAAAAGAEADPTQYCDDIWSSFFPTMYERTDSSYISGPIECTIGTTAGDVPGIGTQAAAGPRNDEMLPANCACLIRKVTGTPGRHGRGRNYWPFILSDDEVSEGGQMLVGSQTDTQDAATAFLEALAADDKGMVVFNGSTGFPSAVVGYVVDALVATQRRRLRR